MNKSDIRKRWLVVLLLGCAGVATGCSSDGNDTEDTAGTGGLATGGFAKGSTGAGGSSTGGVATGGVGMGGTYTGGVAAGGAAVEGFPTGDVTSGGSLTGGVPTGGVATGGGLIGGAPATGGDGGLGGTGGDSTGGAGTGGGATCPPTATVAPGDSAQTVQSGGMNRNYVLHVPPSYDGTTPMPVVVDFHPLGGTGQQQMNSNGWRAKADSEGFIAVYPDSYNNNNSWNVGMCCMDAQQNQIDDAGFAREIIAQLQEIACIDPKRVYATGCSNGGGMTYKVACDAADVFAAGAPVDFRCVYGGGTSAPSCEGCQPSRPITIIHFDNTGDNALVPYNGGMTSFAADCPPNQLCTGMGFPSAQDDFATWQQIAGCTGSASPTSGHSECNTNSSCEGGAQVTMCVQQGGSHCGNYSSLGIVDIAWEMFSQVSLP